MEDQKSNLTSDDSATYTTSNFVGTQAICMIQPLTSFYDDADPLPTMTTPNS